jgi:transposase-like protein
MLFFAFPEQVSRFICITNAIETVNAQLRPAVRAKGHFPSDDAATKLLDLIISCSLNLLSVRCGERRKTRWEDRRQRRNARCGTLAASLPSIA